MSKELSPELYNQIEQEAAALTNKLSSNSEQDKDVQAGFFSGYEDGATKYALLLQSEQEKRKEVEDMMEKMRLALTMTVFALKLSYDVVEYPANGTSEQDSGIRIGEETLTQYNNYKSKKDGTVNG